MAVSTVEDICNLALRQINYPVPIASIYDGSRASRVAVEIYGQTRDNLLGARDWPFARQAVVLTLLKTAPVGGYSATQWSSAYPPLPWIYEYAYPSNAIDVRSVRPTAILLPEYDPRPNVFVSANDPALGEKVVLTDLRNATAVITAQITQPLQWLDPNFIEALVDALAMKFQSALNPNLEAMKERALEQQTAVAIADQRRG